MKVDGIISQGALSILVHNILIKNGLPPAPQRKGMSWEHSIKSHLDVAWAADFSPKKFGPWAQLVTFYTLFIIHLKTRRVHIAGCTPNPDSAWIKQQARNFSLLLDDIDEKCRQGIGNQIPLGFEYPQIPAEASQVGCKSSLGGLLKHYYFKKAA
ncbi:MAG: hypothetical protein PVJ19_14580 [Desulfobacteraceae bacterium]